MGRFGMWGLVRGAAVVLVAGVVMALAHPQLLFSEGVFGRGDAFVFFTPLWALRDEALRAGTLPLWTDRLFMGAPLLSDPQLGTFYPPNWLTVGLPTPTALKVATWLHLAWALAGAYLLARRQVGLTRAGAAVVGICFGLGGYLTSHADQINQLQGMSWMPWGLLALGAAARRPIHGGLLLAGVLGMVALSGHTQTLFINGVALGLGALGLPLHHGPTPRRQWGRRAVLLMVLAVASVLALVLAAVQLLPALELTGLSNRSDGFSARAAMAFSWNPALAARGLLPSYDGQVFGEYVVYLGVSGLALAVYGLLRGDRRRWRWGLLAAAGIFLALGLYNPVYWWLAELPGFNLFRVPARWLVLLALGGAMLAGLGAEALWARIRAFQDAPAGGGGWRALPWAEIAPLLVLGGLMLGTLLADRAAIEVDGPARPTLSTWAGWAAAAVLLVNLALLGAGRAPRAALVALTLALVGGELALAARFMPINDLVTPSVVTDPRGTARYIAAAGIEGRTLSISQGYFDTYDKDALSAHFSALGMSERASKAGLTAAKLHELGAPNLSALDGLRSVDGFGGGVLPTVYWSAFSAAIQPPGALRSIDGRLREYLAQPECLGACIPDPRILWLTGVETLILDKTADRFYDDIQFDVSLPAALEAGERTHVLAAQPFATTHVHVLLAGDPAALSVMVDEQVAGLALSEPVEDGLTRAVYLLPMDGPMVSGLTLTASAPLTVRAVSLVDARTGDFVQLVPLAGWQRALSSDIKLYRPVDAPARVFVARRVRYETDDWASGERTIETLRDPSLDLRAEVVLHLPEGVTPEALGLPAGETAGGAVITAARAGELSVTVSTRDGGVLVFNESYYPGWVAIIDGQDAPVYRANINMQAVVLPAGAQHVTLAYRPPWLRPVLALGAAAWVLWAIALLGVNALADRRRIEMA